MKHDGKIIVLAYPDTFVKMSDEWICRFLPLVGLGTREFIKAGHAALVLVSNHSAEAHYFDFGRYITPDGFGRVRSSYTDAELTIPIKAQITPSGSLDNLEALLLWLDANEEHTHGSGRLLASVCDRIDYSNALAYILELQSQGSIPYGAFAKNGSNCSRFVTETLLAATDDPLIIKRLKWNKKFTPSTVGNVEKAATECPVYEVDNGEVRLFKGTAFKENLKNYFDKNNTLLPATPSKSPTSTAHYLSGIGSSAWFDLEPTGADNQYVIKRYNEDLSLQFKGVFKPAAPFDATQAFRFTYDSHCAICHIVQNEKRIQFNLVEALVLD
ncbi:MAG: DUF6695 family protein [Gilvibacter sp.]